MGKVKQLWMDKMDQVGEDYVNKIISFQEALNKLCALGLEQDYVLDSLDAIDQLEVFKKSDKVTVDIAPTSGAKYGETKFGE